MPNTLQCTRCGKLFSTDAGEEILRALDGCPCGGRLRLVPASAASGQASGRGPKDRLEGAGTRRFIV